MDVNKTICLRDRLYLNSDVNIRNDFMYKKMGPIIEPAEFTDYEINKDRR